MIHKILQEQFQHFPGGGWEGEDKKKPNTLGGHKKHTKKRKL